MFISWMFITPSFKKSLIVEQFQGNYLKLRTEHNKFIFKQQSVSVEELSADSCPGEIWCS